MSWNGVGSFNRIFSWIADKNSGLDISSSRMDTDTNDIASNGFGNCLTRDGQGSASANLPMNNFRHTSVGNGVARSDYAAMAQAQDGLLSWSIAGGTADALTVTLTPAITALADGQLIFARGGAANATTTPTLVVNSIGPHTITRSGGAALAPLDIPGSLAECIFRYNLAAARFELLNPAVGSSGVPLGALIPFTGSSSPNSNFVLPAGQAISRTTFAAYFALVGTTYGAGDGSTTFNVVDMRGCTFAALDNLGGVAAGRIGTLATDGGTIVGTALGSFGGSQSHVQTGAEGFSHAHTGSGNVSDPTHGHNFNLSNVLGGGAGNIPVGSNAGVNTSNGTSNTSGVTGVTVPSLNINASGSSAAMAWLQPTRIVGCLLRVA